MSPEDHFTAIADKYSRGRFGYPDELYQHLSAICPSRACAWDCAAGSGQATIHLAKHFDHVIATDISAALLDRIPAHPKVTIRTRPAEDSGLPDESVDLITVAQAIHWFDQTSFAFEANRVLKNQGILAFWGYNWAQVDEATDRLLEEFKQEIAAYWPDRSKLLHENYRSIHPPMEELSKPQLTISQNWGAEDYIAHLQSWSAVKYYEEQRGENPVAKYRPAIAAIWGTTSKIVRWPLVLRVFRKE